MQNTDFSLSEMEKEWRLSVKGALSELREGQTESLKMILSIQQSCATWSKFDVLRDSLSVEAEARRAGLAAHDRELAAAHGALYALRWFVGALAGSIAVALSLLTYIYK